MTEPGFTPFDDADTPRSNSLGLLIAPAITGVIEAAFNQWLAKDPHSADKMRRFSGKVVELELRGLNQSLYLLPTEQGVLFQARHEGGVDATLSGTPLALAGMSLSDKPSRSLFSGKVEIRGNVGVGQGIRKVLDEVKVDWEEDLSHYTGDLVAHQLGNLIRNGLDWAQRNRRVTEQNSREYLQEELRMLPTRYEAEEFATGVDATRNDIERLEARVTRLKSALQDTPSP